MRTVYFYFLGTVWKIEMVRSKGVEDGEHQHRRCKHFGGMSGNEALEIHGGARRVG